ncbi:alpha/beta-hydrolase family protein [Fodinibacter luteus]|uniref:Alpha/beta-hydrolase family protein n=1 Tax=Fodinibacter luteus TaxID=552064 RepID=A0ABP8JXY7_9MICO
MEADGSAEMAAPHSGAAGGPPPGHRRLGRLSLTGAAVGLVLAGMSSTPSLVPRGWLVNAVLVGVCAATGYAVGAAVGWGWRVLSLPTLGTVSRRRGWWAVGLVALVGTLILGWLSREWQREQRELFGMDPGVTWWWLATPVLGLVIAAVLLGVGRGVKLVGRFAFRVVRRVLPERASWLVAALSTAALVWVGLAVTVTVLLYVASRSFVASDLQDYAGVTQPASAHRSGGPASVVEWGDIGREGRAFVTGGPSASDIATVMSDPGAAEPVRAYVGLGSPGTAQDRAETAIRELHALGAFQRSAIAVAGTTGTGWIDPEAAAALEYVARGDVATVATQYSFFPSWMSFMSDRGAAERNSELLITALRVELDGMPASDRPSLYVYGESLGAFSTDNAFTSVEDISTTTDGALLIGPPSFDRNWQKVQEGREPGSALWQPAYGSGELVRAADTDEDITDQTLTWRTDNPIIYLSHASDPVVAWTADLGEWLENPGPDTHPATIAWPVVGAVQTTLDQLGATAVPPGHGHVYDETVVTAWSEILGPPSLPDEQIDAIRSAVRVPSP